MIDVYDKHYIVCPKPTPLKAPITTTTKSKARGIKMMYCMLSGSKGAVTKCLDAVRYKHTPDSFHSVLFIL